MARWAAREICSGVPFCRTVSKTLCAFAAVSTALAPASLSAIIACSAASAASFLARANIFASPLSSPTFSMVVATASVAAAFSRRAASTSAVPPAATLISAARTAASAFFSRLSARISSKLRLAFLAAFSYAARCSGMASASFCSETAKFSCPRATFTSIAAFAFSAADEFDILLFSSFAFASAIAILPFSTAKAALVLLDGLPVDILASRATFFSFASASSASARDSRTSSCSVAEELFIPAPVSFGKALALSTTSAAMLWASVFGTFLCATVGSFPAFSALSAAVTFSLVASSAFEIACSETASDSRMAACALDSALS